MILLPPTSDTGLLSTRAIRKVVPYRSTSPVRPLVNDLPVLFEGAVLRLMGGGRACEGSLDAPLAASCSGFGEIAASTCTAIARERGVA